MRELIGKNPTIIHVAALALIDASGLVLMHRRRKSSMHGGLWEFPGGKLEHGENHADAVVREISEELGISLAHEALEQIADVCGEPSAAGDSPVIAIRLYAAHDWRGDPQCLEGEEIAWFASDALSGLAMPPLDYPLAEELRCRLAKEAK